MELKGEHQRLTKFFCRFILMPEFLVKYTFMSRMLVDKIKTVRIARHDIRVKNTSQVIKILKIKRTFFLLRSDAGLLRKRLFFLLFLLSAP